MLQTCLKILVVRHGHNGGWLEEELLTGFKTRWQMNDLLMTALLLSIGIFAFVSAIRLTIADYGGTCRSLVLERVCGPQ